MVQEAPWTLMGEAIIAFSRRPKTGRRPLPHGVHRLFGPQVIVAERFSDSPVGPFSVVSIAEPAFSGLRVGLHVTTCVLSNGDARLLMRQRWGFPVELGALSWSNEGVERTLAWDDRNLEIHAKPHKKPLPMSISLRMLQRTPDGPVSVPTRTRGLVHRAIVDVRVAEDEPFTYLAGRHRGFWVSNALMRRSAARKTRGLPRLRAPRRFPEPGVIGMGDWPLRAQRQRHRRLQWRSPSGV